jgi:ribosomal protein L22
MTPDETPKDELTPAEIEAKASEEAAESQPAPKTEKPATSEAAESKPAASAARGRGGERSETGPPRQRRKPAAKKAGTPKAEEPKKPARASSRRRGSRPAAEPAVLVRAQAKYVRTSARKARLVCDHIRGKDVAEARAILAFTPRGAAKAWSKLLESAVANAENNHELVGEELRIHSVVADEGPTLKRFRPRAMGRATRIRKRTSHLTITLTPKES